MGPEEAFAEEEGGEGDREDDAEFVDGGDGRDSAELEGAEVTEPRESGCEAGEDEEKPGAAGDLFDRAKGCREGEEDDAPSEDKDDRGSQGGREVGVDSSDSDFGEDGGEAGKEC